MKLAMEISVLVYKSLSDYQKSIEYHKKHLKTAIEIGDRSGGGRGYGSIGIAYMSLGGHRESSYCTPSGVSSEESFVCASLML